jgi:hypothetical protein
MIMFRCTRPTASGNVGIAMGLKGVRGVSVVVEVVLPLEAVEPPFALESVGERSECVDEFDIVLRWCAEWDWRLCLDTESERGASESVKLPRRLYLCPPATPPPAPPLDGSSGPFAPFASMGDVGFA